MRANGRLMKSASASKRGMQPGVHAGPLTETGPVREALIFVRQNYTASSKRTDTANNVWAKAIDTPWAAVNIHP